MIKLSRLGTATFETPDLDKAIAYYTQVNGLVLDTKEHDRAFLASKTGLLTTLEQGGEPKLERLLFEVSPSADFTGIASKLSADGVQSEVRSDSCPGIGKVLAFNDQIPLAGCAGRLRNAPVHAA
jgi:hypothetical protein